MSVSYTHLDKLESFKRNAGLTNIGSDAQLAVEGNAEYEKKRVENGTQINLSLIHICFSLLPGIPGRCAGCTTDGRGRMLCGAYRSSVRIQNR